MKKGGFYIVLAILIILAIVSIAVSFILVKAYETEDFNDICKKISLPDGKKRLLFIPNNYDSYSEFEKDVLSKVEVIRKTSPFEDAFSFYLFQHIENNFDCSKKDAIICDYMKITEVARYCPHDYIVVLSNENDEFLRSTAYMNIAVVNSIDDPGVLLHELGHIISNLADEYVTDLPETEKNLKKSPNCDNSECSKWLNEFIGTGCFPGCTNSDFYRSSENSVMRNCYTSRQYYQVNVFALKSSLENE